MKRDIAKERLKENIPKGNVCSFHAEMVALSHLKGDGIHERRAYLKSKNAVMIVIRVMKDGRLGNSAPCKSCHEHLTKYGFKVYYSC